MASASSDSTAALAVANQFLLFTGPFLIAYNITLLLYGCFLVQIYHYYTSSFHSAKDRWVKLLVGAAGLAATLHMGLASVAEWKFLVKHWGDADIWANAPWEVGLTPFTVALSGIFVQLFFVFRIITFSRHILARSSAAIISLAALSALGGATATAATFFQGGANFLDQANLRTAIMVWSISSAICDVMIAATMIIILWYACSQTSVKRMQSVLTRLILHSIETGTVTAVNMLLYLICYEAFKGTIIFAIPGLVIGPLYGNVLLFVLNSRQRNRAELNQRDSFHLSGGVATSSGKVTTESDILARYNTYATELSGMGDNGQGRSSTDVSAQ